MDVEGYEPFVLSGSEALFRNHKVCVVLVIHRSQSPLAIANSWSRLQTNLGWGMAVMSIHDGSADGRHTVQYCTLQQPWHAENCGHQILDWSPDPPRPGIHSRVHS